MHLPPEAAKRYHLIMYALWSMFRFSQRELMEAASISQERRHTVWRAHHGKNAHLLIKEARHTVFVAASYLTMPISADEIWEWIINIHQAASPLLHDLLVTTSRPLSTSGLHNLATALASAESEAKEEINCAVIPKQSALAQATTEFVHRKSTQQLGEKAKRAFTDLNTFIKNRRKFRDDGNQLPLKQTHLQLASNLEQFRDGTGWLAGMPSEQRGQGLKAYIDNAIFVRGNFVGVIPDELVPSKLLAHFKSVEGTFILDDNFLYRVHRGGLARGTCDGRRNPSNRPFIQEQRAKLLELQRYVTHDWSKQQMRNALEKFMPDASR